MHAESLKWELERVHARVLSHFVFKSDRAENWRMPPKNYDGSQLIRDDCDGFCLAIRKLLRDKNIPSRLVYCKIDNVGHLVVEVEGWILDNRQKSVAANTLLKTFGYKFIQMSGFEPGDPWRRIVN